MSVREDIVKAMKPKPWKVPPVRPGEIRAEIAKATDRGKPKEVPPGGSVPKETVDDLIATLRWQMRDNVRMFGDDAMVLNQAYLRSIRALQKDPRWKDY